MTYLSGTGRLLTTLLFLTIPLGSLIAQPDLGKLFGSQTQVIERALDSVLFIVRQDYVLSDTSGSASATYGRAGQDYFGRTYALGVLAGAHLYVSGSGWEPWLRDSNYADFASDTSYVPVLSGVALRRIGGTDFRELPAEIQLERSPVAYRYAVDSLGMGAGLSFYPPDSATAEGVQLMVSAKQEFSTTEAQKPLLSVKLNEVQLAGQHRVTLPGRAATKLTALGGVYLIPVYGSGSVQFRLLGLIEQRAGRNTVIPLASENDAPVGLTPKPGPAASVQPLVFDLRHEDGFALANVTVTVGNQKMTTDPNGRIVIHPSNATELLTAQLNGVTLGCGRSGDVVNVICQFKKGNFLPVKKVKCQ